jgi:hydroxyethylthiazole kinase-like uncharacterized protein yjeF
MEKLLSVAEMQSIEREANDKGLSYSTMMENAGTNLAFFIHNAYGDPDQRSVLALVGSGNNGGDALVALCKLIELGWRTSAYIVKRRPERDYQLQRYLQKGGSILEGGGDQVRFHLEALLTQSSVLIDGVLGTGVRFPLHTEIAKVLAFAKCFIEARKSLVHVVAVDCPSGVDCDTGEVAPEVIPAEITFTMAAIKRGLLAFPAANMVGDIRVGNIGDTSKLDTWSAVKRGVLTDLDMHQYLPPRPRNAHKGTFGTVLLVAGSGNYPGAVVLAGMGAYRIGAGLVKIAVPELIFSSLIGALKEATWVRLPHSEGWISENANHIVTEALVGVNALLVGPGIGLEKRTGDFIRGLIETDLPKTVIDADGLKLLAHIPEWYSILHGQVVLTPHPGEMAVLSGLTKEEIQSSRIEVAEYYARRWGKVVVLKGAYSVIAEPSGNTAVVPVATSALARAGTGDVLAGFIVGLLAQGLTPFQAACAGAYIHAMAGLEAAEDQGNTSSVLAGDVLDMVPRILSKYNKS